MEMKAIFLEGPRHIRIPKNRGNSVIPSDTLFSSICCSVKRLGLDLEDFIGKFKEGGCLITSLFPFQGGPEGRKLYFPKPYYLNLIVEKMLERCPEERRKEITKEIKEVKKIRYLSKEAFEKAINGEEIGIDEIISRRSFYFSESFPRASLDRVTQDSSLYYLEEEFSERDVGTWLGYVGDEKVLQEYVLPALRELGDSGLGGKGTWGMGHFEVKEVSKIEVRSPSESENFLTLSLTLITSDAKNYALLWDLVQKGGWRYPFDGRPVRKPIMWYFSEGSVFKGRFEGKILDLEGEEFRISIYGKSFLIPCKLPEGMV